MKKSVIFSLLVGLFLLMGANDVFAQGAKKKSSGVDQYFEEKGFLPKLWGGAYLGSPSFFNGIFQMGLQPMVGYKITPKASVGVITKFDYYWERINLAGVDNFRALDFSYGAFGRYKVFQQYFAHIEYETTSFERVNDLNGGIQVDNGKILTRRFNQEFFYIGGGYNGGNGIWGFEFLALYNLRDAGNSQRPPFDIRGGITYKF